MLATDLKLTTPGLREYAHFAAPEVLALNLTGLGLAGLLTGGVSRRAPAIPLSRLPARELAGPQIADYNGRIGRLIAFQLWQISPSCFPATLGMSWTSGSSPRNGSRKQ